MLAHLGALATRHDPAGRQRYKVRLVKGLYDRGWTAEDVRQLFRLIGWLMELPPALEQRFREEIYQWEEERRMPFMTSFEQMGLEKGPKKGLKKGLEKGRLEATQEAVAKVLEVNFGTPGKRLMSRIGKIRDLEQLQALFAAILTADSLAEVRQLLHR